MTVFKKGYRSVQMVGNLAARQGAADDESQDSAAEIAALTARVSALEAELAALTERVVLLEPQMIYTAEETDAALPMEPV